MKDYIVDGVPLRDPQGKWFIDYTRSETLTTVSRVHNVINVYGFHGDLESNSSYFGAASEVIVLHIVAADKNELNTLISAFYALFSSPALPVLTAPQRSSLRFNRRHTNLFATGVAVKTASMRLNGEIKRGYISENASTLTIPLAINAAFWRSTGLEEQSWQLSNQTASIDLDIMAGDSTAPLTDIQLRLTGPIPVTAVVTIADSSDPSRSISTVLTAAIASGSSLILSSDTLKQARGSSASSWTGVAVGSMRNNGIGQFFVDRFQVAAAFPATTFGYRLKMTATGLTSATTVTARARKAYLT